MPDTSVITQDDLAAFKKDLIRELSGQFAPGTVTTDVQKLQGWQKKMDADGSLGRVFNGPQWLDGVAVRDGVITGAKLAANLVISNLFTTVDPDVSTTDDRMELDDDGLRWYGTVSGTGNTKIAEFAPTGFSLGSGSKEITYDASTGAMVIPVATISGLTIAQVGDGILGGLYKTAASGARLELDTSGLRAYNSGGTKTVDLSASAGDLTITGTFAIQSATSAARVEIKNSGIKIYDSGGTVRAQLLNDGSGFIGSTSGLASSAAVSWTSGGTTSVNATNVNTGSLNGALLSSGTVSDSAVASLAANKITAGTGVINALTIKSTLTLGSGGSIVDGDGSTWDQNGITLKGSSDFIKFQTGSSTVGSILGSSGLLLSYGTGSGGGVWLTSSYAMLAYEPTAVAISFYADSSTAQVRNLSGSHNYWDTSLNHYEYGRLYPGTGSGNQTSRYIDDNGSNLRVTTSTLQISGASGTPGINFTNIGNGGSATNWSTNAPTGAAYFQIQLGGVTYRVPFYANA